MLPFPVPSSDKCWPEASDAPARLTTEGGQELNNPICASQSDKFKSSRGTNIRGDH